MPVFKESEDLARIRDKIKDAMRRSGRMLGKAEVQNAYYFGALGAVANLNVVRSSTVSVASLARPLTLMNEIPVS